MSTQAIRLHVTGKVQGVFYRKSTQAKAQELGLAGWVQNERDGAVTIVAEGEATALAALQEWCWQGPAEARVEDIKARTQPAQGYRDFEIVQ